MKLNNPWNGPVEGLPEGGEFTHDGEVLVQVIAIGKDFQDYQYSPVIQVKAGDNIDELRTLVIDWILEHGNDSLPGVQSVDYTVQMVAPFGEALPQEEEFRPESFGSEGGAGDSSSGG
jgi:hypothetical protein